MAIYHLSAKIISRSSGRSAVGSAAYRASERLYNNYDGITHDYTKKSGTVFREILLADTAPKEYLNRQILWNAVEKSERRKDAQTAREIEVALPVEFDRKKQIDVLREYVCQQFVSKGMCADIAIHDKTDNPHAHIMLTTRYVNHNGFSDKCRDWNRRELLEDWRKEWADICNREFESKKLETRIDHRSFERQGLEELPTIHLGTSAHNLEKKGIRTERGDYNRHVVEHNAILRATVKELAMLIEQRERMLAELNKGSNPLIPISRDALIAVSASPSVPDRTTATKVQSSDQRDEDNILALSAEHVAERIFSLKKEYFVLYNNIQRITSRREKLQDEIQRIRRIIDNINKDVQNIRLKTSGIALNEDKLSDVGIFNIKTKNALKTSLNTLKNDLIISVDNFKQKYGTSHEDADKAISERRGFIQQLQERLKALPNLQELWEKLRQIGLEIKKLWLLVTVHPEERKIKELDNNNVMILNGQSVRGNMELYRLNSKLDEITAEDYKQILPQLQSEQVLKVQEERNKTYEYRQERHYDREDDWEL